MDGNTRETGSSLFNSGSTTINVSRNFLIDPTASNGAVRSTHEASGTVSYGRISLKATVDAQLLRGANSGAYTILQGSWEDRIRVASTSLIVGTPVQIRFESSLTGLLQYNGAVDYSQTNPNGVPLGYASAQSVFSVNTVNSQRIFRNTDSAYGRAEEITDAPIVYSTRVGDFVDIRGYLALQVAGGLYTDDGRYRTSNTSFSAIADFGNTANYFITPLSQGITFESASGTTYASVVAAPEPGAFALLLSGLVLGAGILRRRTCKA